MGVGRNVGSAVVKYAVIDVATGEVVNIALWDGVSDWHPGDGLFAVPGTEGCQIGGTFDGQTNVFSPPAQPEAEVAQ